MVSRSETAAGIAAATTGHEVIMFRVLPTLVAIWLIIGAIAGWQRHYYSGHVESCAHAGTIAATIFAGPLNYVGANPKVHCKFPQPSH